MKNQNKNNNSRILYQQQRNEWLLYILFCLFIVCSIILLEFGLYKPTENHHLNNTLNITAALLNTQKTLNEQTTKPSIDTLTNHPDIHYAVLIDHEGKAIARSRKSVVQGPYRWLTGLLRYSKPSLILSLKSPESKPTPVKIAKDSLDNVKSTDQIKKIAAKGAYLLVELDTYHMGMPFLKRLLLQCLIMIIGGICLSGFFIWFHRRHYTTPILVISHTIDGVLANSSDENMLSPEKYQHSFELSQLTNSINRLIKTISINTSRRERAEDDLRKNLASIDHIVSERTQALRSSNVQIQDILKKQEHKASLLETKSKEITQFFKHMTNESVKNIIALNKKIESSSSTTKINMQTVLESSIKFYSEKMEKQKIPVKLIKNQKKTLLQVSQYYTLVPVLSETLKMLSEYGKGEKITVNQVLSKELTAIIYFKIENRNFDGGETLTKALGKIKQAKSFTDSGNNIEEIQQSYFKQQLGTLGATLEFEKSQQQLVLSFSLLPQESRNAS